ncbi:hypothetical protein OUZ56_016478 [Daphnia magna]|uniref:Uncharacterized protein n=1 Tax=Daphnia magna TaxID=35525 RepID=A0ABR0AQP9_9CRUS|nr:hypothetical protein OUZ56_016478 [Daphnia magna]
MNCGNSFLVKLALTPTWLFGSVRSIEGKDLWEELNRRLVENKIPQTSSDLELNKFMINTQSCLFSVMGGNKFSTILANNYCSPPLIDLYARMSATQDDTPAGVRSRRTLQAALQQWGRAFAHISRNRREAVINVTDPRVDYLLKDKAVFTTGKEAREHLFTGEFLNLMLKEASQDDETLAKRYQAAAATSSEKRNPIRMVRYDNLAPRDYGDDFQPTE